MLSGGNDIHTGNKEIIEKIKRIPYELRFRWGLYKNLLCGVTTVAHHGNGMIFNYDGMPQLINNYNYIHSVRLERMWEYKLNLMINDNLLSFMWERELIENQLMKLMT